MARRPRSSRLPSSHSQTVGRRSATRSVRARCTSPQTPTADNRGFGRNGAAASSAGASPFLHRGGGLFLEPDLSVSPLAVVRSKDLSVTWTGGGPTGDVTFGFTQGIGATTTNVNCLGTGQRWGPGGPGIRPQLLDGHERS